MEALLRIINGGNVLITLTFGQDKFKRSIQRFMNPQWAFQRKIDSNGQKSIF